jgi:hypothetical protein
MSLETLFSKSSKAAIQEFKVGASQMISNGCNFSCQSLSISASNGEETVFPDSEYVKNWVQNLLKNELKSKPLNPKALEEMAKKGITPKKQPNEIILIVIVPSNTEIHIGLSIPQMDLNIEQFLNCVLSQYTNPKFVFDGNFAFVDIEHPESLKERDVVLRSFFSELKLRKIYVDDEEDEQITNYLE